MVPTGDASRRTNHQPDARRRAREQVLKPLTSTSIMTARTVLGSSSASGISNSSLTDPDTVYAGVEDVVLLFRSTDGGQTWYECPVCAAQKESQPAAGGMCLHTVPLPSSPKRIYVAISAAGVFRTDDAGKTWRPTKQGPEIPV